MDTQTFESAWRAACECNVLLSPAEGKALHDRVIRAPENVVEVGSYFGGSAVILAKAGAHRLTLIEPHTRPELLLSLARTGLLHEVRLLSYADSASSGICGTRPSRSCSSTTSTTTSPPATVSPPGGVIWFPGHRSRCMIMWHSRKCGPPRTSSHRAAARRTGGEPRLLHVGHLTRGPGMRVVPVVVAYFSADWIRVGITSYLHHFPDDRVLVVDNNPRRGEVGWLPLCDRERHWLRSHPRVDILANPLRPSPRSTVTGRSAREWTRPWPGAAMPAPMSCSTLNPTASSRGAGGARTC